MRNCNCAGSTCGCLVVGSTGIEVTGTGTAADPYSVKNIAADLGTAFQVSDTLTLNLTKAGAGTNVDPIILSGVVTLQLQQLTDVNDPQGGPVASEVPTYVGTAGSGGHWEFRTPHPPYTTATRPAANTLRPGAGYFDTTLNKPIWSDGTAYRDATGAVV